MTSEDLKLYNQIDSILHSEWNPVDISEVSKHEYQTYLPYLFCLKKAGADSEVLAQTLSDFESHILGMTSDIYRCTQIARRIESL